MHVNLYVYTYINLFVCVLVCIYVYKAVKNLVFFKLTMDLPKKKHLFHDVIFD